MRLARIARYCLYFLLTTLGLLSVCIVLLLTLDLGWLLRERAETFASEMLGSDVEIDGPLHLDLGRTISFSAENAHIVSPDWSAERDLVSVRRLESHFDAWSLLDETIQVDSITIDGLRVHLERDVDGSSNWPSLLAVRVIELLVGQSIDLPAVVARVEIVDSVVRYMAPGRLRDAILTVPRTAVRLEDSALYHAELDGELNATPLSISLDARAVQDTADRTGAEIEFLGELGEVYFEGETAFADLFETNRPTARLEVAGPSVEYLTDVLGIERITSGPLDVSLTIEPAGEDIQFSLSGDMGEFAVMAAGRFDDLQRLERVDVEFSARGPSADTIMELLDWPTVPDAAFDASGAIRRDGSDAEFENVSIAIGETRLVIDGQFYDLPNPSMSNARLQISGPDIGQFDDVLDLPGPLDGPFELTADLQALETGGAQVDITGTVRDLVMRIQGELGDSPDLVGSELNLSLSGEDSSVVARAAGHDTGTEEHYMLEMFLSRSPEATIIEHGIASLGQDRFTFSGRVGDGSPAEWMLVFDGTIPDMAGRLAGFGIEQPWVPAGLAEISATVRNAGAGYLIDAATISVAGMDVALRGRLGPLPGFEGSDLEVRASGSSLANAFPMLEDLVGSDGSFAITATARIGAGEVVLEEAALEVDDVALDGSLALALDERPLRGSFSVETSSTAVLERWPMLAELAQSEGEPFAVSVAGGWSEAAWNIDVLDMAIAGASLTAGGRTSGPPSFGATALIVDGETPSLSTLNALVGRELPDVPARMQFELTGDREQFALRNLTGVSGDSDLRGDIEFKAGDVWVIEADLRSDRIDLVPYLEARSEESVEDEVEQIDNDGRWLPEFLVQIDALKEREVAASVRANEVRTRRRTLNDVTLEASILNGVLRLGSFDLETDGGTMRGELTLRRGEIAPEIAVRISGENISIGLDALSPEDLSTLPRYTADLGFAASGNSLQEMAATMNGYLYLVGGAGKVRSTAIRFYTRDFFSELFDTLNPSSATDPDLELSCAVVLAAIEDGVVTGDPALVMQSDEVTVYADARIDLETELVDVNLRTVPRRGLGISLSDLISPYVKIGGTLSEPSVAFDPEGTLIEGGLAVATGGASLIAENLWERFLSAGDPCDRAISYADERLQELEDRFGPAVSAALR